MELKYFGTGGAEGIPALFCNCELCNYAMNNGGRDVRTRCQAMVDRFLLIDYPPDSYLHMLSNKFSFFNITHMLVTHSHCDHFYPQDLNRRWGNYAYGIEAPLHIYGNEMVGHFFEETCGDGFGVLSFHTVEPFCAYTINNYWFMPMPAQHDKTERCYIYLVSDGNKTLLYAHDTGPFLEVTWNYLERHKPRIHMASLDCGYLSRKVGEDHMTLEDASETRLRLISSGCCTQNDTFAISHITHNGLWSYKETVKRAEPLGITTAYDGLAIDF